MHIRFFCAGDASRTPLAISSRREVNIGFEDCQLFRATVGGNDNIRLYEMAELELLTPCLQRRLEQILN